MSEKKQYRTNGERLRDQALKEAGRNRTQAAVQRAEKGIRQLLKDGGTISFSSVSRAAGVSTKFLHQNEDLATRIRHLSAQQKGTQRPNTPDELTGESAIIAALRRQLTDQDERHKKQVRELKNHIRQLEQQNEVLYGKLIFQSKVNKSQ